MWCPKHQSTLELDGYISSRHSRPCPAPQNGHGKTWGNLYSQRVLATLETLGIHISLLPQVVPGEVGPEMTWNSAVSSQASPQPQWTMNFLIYPLVMTNVAIENGHRNSGFSHWKWWFSIVMLVYQRVILIYHLPLSSVAHRLHPPNLRNPHQLQINYISENHQNPRPNSHKCLKISINPTVWCFSPPFWPWTQLTQPVVLRITSRAVLCASSLLGGRQVDASRSRAQPVEFKVALQYVAPPTEEPMELGVEFLWCFFQLKLENLSTSFWWVEIWILGSQRARVMGRATIAWQFQLGNHQVDRECDRKSSINQGLSIARFDCHTARRYLYY